jgi:hypothetical protein
MAIGVKENVANSIEDCIGDWYISIAVDARIMYPSQSRRLVPGSPPSHPSINH